MKGGQSSVIHSHFIGSEGQYLQDKQGVRLAAAKRRLSKRQSDIQDEQRAWFLSGKTRWTGSYSQKVTQRGNRLSGRPSGRWGKRNRKTSGETTKVDRDVTRSPLCTYARDLGVFRVPNRQWY